MATKSKSTPENSEKTLNAPEKGINEAEETTSSQDTSTSKPPKKKRTSTNTTSKKTPSTSKNTNVAKEDNTSSQDASTSKPPRKKRTSTNTTSKKKTPSTRKKKATSTKTKKPASTSDKEVVAKSDDFAEVEREMLERAAQDEEREEIAKLKRFYLPLQYSVNYYAKQVKEYIIGQDQAVDELCYIVYHNMYQNYLQDLMCIDGSCVHAIALGPSGCGKTATLNKISELFHIPFAKYNATPLTSAGFVGKDVETMLQRLLDAANGDMLLAQRGILYIDEIDKKKKAAATSNTSGRDANGTSVQQELLKFLEASEIDLGNGVIFNTTHLTIIMTGAFLGIDDIRAKRLKKVKPAGFSSEEPAEYETFSPDPFEDDFNEFDETNSPEITSEDVVNFGFIEEFVGRVKAIIEFKKLTLEDMVNIITVSKGSPIMEFDAQCKSHGISLEISPENYNRMAEAAMNSKMGARHLQKIIFNFLKPGKLDLMCTALLGTGLMYYDFDGNYEFQYETVSPHLFIQNYVDGPRKKRRERLMAERNKHLSKLAKTSLKPTSKKCNQVASACEQFS